MELLGRLHSLLLMVVLAVVGGALVAGMAIPVAALVTTAGKQSVEAMHSLPVELETPPMPERSRLLNADKSVLAYFYEENRRYVSLDGISDIMKTAIVAIEDHRFYEHGALDFYATLRAAVSTVGGVAQGASSISQQYVRLALVGAAQQAGDKEGLESAREFSLSRKIREMRYAIGLEKRLSKDEILERYLNISYFGDGAHGVEAAAEHYFGVKAKDLNLPQAAMLAGLVRSPGDTDPVNNLEIALSRRTDVLNRMVELKIITSEEAEDAKQTRFDSSKVRKIENGCRTTEFPFICDYAWKTLMQTESLGATAEDRKQRVNTGGLTIQTQIDPKTQRKAEQVIAKKVSPKDPAIAVITMMEPSTGQIVAMAQSRPDKGTNLKKGETWYNYAASNEMGGADGFQGGSTFKVFVAAAALEAGMGAYGVYDAKSRMSFAGQIFKNCDGPFRLDEWNVVNSGGTGKRDMFSGVKKSVNTYFAQLIQAVGVCKAVKMAERVGLEEGRGRDLVKEYGSSPAFTLGAVEVTPLSMVRAYATFANRGVRCDPIILKSIKTVDGEKLEVPGANCKRVVSEEIADTINYIFQGPFNGGTASSAKVPGVQMAGKTGTVPKNKAVWTVGYTPELVAAAVISYDNNKRFKSFWDKQRSYLRWMTLPESGTYLSGFSGLNAGNWLLKPAFAAAIKNYKQTRFHGPSQKVLRGESRSVPSCTGMSVSTCEARLRDAGFTSYTNSVDSVEKKGTVIGLSPSGKAPKLSSIGIRVSNGKLKEKKEEAHDGPRSGDASGRAGGSPSGNGAERSNRATVPAGETP